MYQKYLAVLISFMLALPLVVSGQASDTTPNSTAPSIAPAAHMKDPGLAALMSFVVPGGGELYAGQKTEGFLLLGFTTGAVVITSKSWPSCHSGGRNSDCGLPIASGLTALGIWIAGMVMAPGAVEEYNESQQQQHAMRVQPIIQIGKADKFGHSPTMFGLNLEF